MPLVMIIAIVLLFLIALIFIGNNWLEGTVYELKSAGLPASFNGFCIVQISDLHNHRFGPYQARFLKLVKGAHPDLIAITGDVANRGSVRLDYILKLIRQLTAIAPCYFVTGNHEAYYHDLPGLLTQLTGAGLKVLRGESVVLERGAESLVVAGLGDPKVFRAPGMSIRQAVAQWDRNLTGLRETLNPERFSILLSHRPEYISRYANLGFDVVLSGHAHGGQVRLPGIGAIYAPNQGWFPRYTSGIYVSRETTLIVSRGLGGSSFPIRVFNRPEIVIVRLGKG